MTTKPDGRRAAPKPKRNNTQVLREPNGKWKKGTPPPNPAGAPKRGESWKEMWATIGNMTPLEAADYCKAIAGQLATIGGDVTLKQAVVLRVYAALLFDPDARLLNSVMDRDEGKVTQAITVEDVTRKPDTELVAEFAELVDAARARAGAGLGGGTQAAGVGGDGAPADPDGVAK